MRITSHPHRWILVLAAIAALTGCAQTGSGQTGLGKITDAQWWPWKEREQTAAPATPAAAPAAAPAPLPAAELVGADKVILTPPRARPAGAAQLARLPKKDGGYAPKDLIGLDGPTLMQLLGQPSLHRREPFAEVWQYSGPDCVLFVYLYKVASGAQQVAHAETDAKPVTAKHDPAACVTGFAARMGG